MSCTLRIAFAYCFTMHYFPFLNNSSKYPVISLVSEDHPRRILIDTIIANMARSAIVGTTIFFRMSLPTSKSGATNSPRKAKPDCFFFSNPLSFGLKKCLDKSDKSHDHRCPYKYPSRKVYSKCQIVDACTKESFQNLL
jgi:hypothetical protein